MIKYEIIEHTADMGIRVFGADLKEVFLNCALAMFDVMVERANPNEQPDLKEIKVNLSAENKEELLIRWLSELVSLADCNHVFFVEFAIESVGEKELKAVVRGAKDSNFIGKTEIKAVTYHNLKIEKINGKYMAQVIFDV